MLFVLFVLFWTFFWGNIGFLVLYLVLLVLFYPFLDIFFGPFLDNVLFLSSLTSTKKVEGIAFFYFFCFFTEKHRKAQKKVEK